jgi:PBS lyase HEAT-like repeat
MSDLLEKFLQATGWPGIVDLARELMDRNGPGDVAALQRALGDPLEARRYAAAHALGFIRRDKRAIRPLIRVLENEQETASVRAQTAESLGMLCSRKAVRALIRCSTDDSAEVRFWCVFGIGTYTRGRHGHKQSLAINRALEARLGDHEALDDRGNYWAVGLEALAMLRRRSTRHAKTFRETMLTVLRDPLSHPDKWRWASCYWDGSDLCGGIGSRDLFDRANQMIHDAGFDPVDFGRKPRIGVHPR